MNRSTQMNRSINNKIGVKYIEIKYIINSFKNLIYYKKFYSI